MGSRETVLPVLQQLCFYGTYHNIEFWNYLTAHSLSIVKPNLSASSRTGRLTVAWKLYAFLDSTLSKQAGLVVDLDTFLDWSNEGEFPFVLLSVSRLGKTEKFA